MEIIDLNGQVRSERGKSEVKKLKARGYVPCIMYGNLEDGRNINISIVRKELEMKVKFPVRQNQLYKFNLSGDVGKETEQSMLVLIKDWQLDPLKTRHWEHIDFYAIDEKSEIRVSIPIKYTGEAEGVNQGGILQAIRRELEVDALPMNIPDSIEVSVSELNIGENIHVNDIESPANSKIHAPTNFALVTVVAPAEEEVAPVAAEAVPAEGEEAAAKEGEEAAAKEGEDAAEPKSKKEENKK